jgi:hypothetical protein
MPEEQIREFAIYGTHEEVRRQIEWFEKTGIEYIIVNLEPSSEIDSLERFAKEIIQNFS